MDFYFLNMQTIKIDVGGNRKPNFYNKKSDFSVKDVPI